MKKMSGHTRLFRRNATYYHRALVPIDIKDTYGKIEETFSLKTKNYKEALRLIKIAAVETDEKFEAHRRYLNRPTLDELSEEQLEQLKQIGIRYVHWKIMTQFHSFRHNFEDACRAALVDKAVMDALQGHTEKGMSGRYGRGYELNILNQELQKIQYEHLKLNFKR